MVNLEVQHRSEIYGVRSKVIQFANAGLSGREISFAIEIKTGLKINPNDVIGLVHRARRRGIVRQLTPEEKKDIAQTSNLWDYSDEVMRGDVLSILRNIEKLQKEGKPLPQNRLELKKYRLPRNKSQQRDSGVQLGQKIVFPDGRYVPTFKGLSQNDKQREILAGINRKPKSREQIVKQSTVWCKVKPLRERLALPSEIAEITGFTKEQVRKAIGRNSRRPEWNRSPVLTPEQVKILRKRAGKAKQPRNPKDRPLPTQNDKNSLVFAQKLLEEGLITSDLFYWIDVNELYKNSRRTLPDNFSEKLRLEALFRVLIELKKGSSETLKKYDKLGREIDDQWFKKTFVEEERFVRAKLLTDWADGEDEKGFYKFENGTKVRHIESVDGEFVNDNSMLAIKKLIRKGVTKRIGNDNKNSKEDWIDE